MSLLRKVNAIITKVEYENLAQVPIEIAGPTKAYSWEWDWDKRAPSSIISNLNNLRYLVRIDRVTYSFEPKKWESLVGESYSKMIIIHKTFRKYKKKKIPVMYYFLKNGKICFAGEPAKSPYFLIQINDKKLPSTEWKIPSIEWKKLVNKSNKTPTMIVQSDKKDDDEFYIYLYKKMVFTSELAMTGSDVLTVLNNARAQKKDTLQRELERVKAKAEATKGSARLSIPDDVQVQVWNRDQGKCVKCGSSENLEFDHIIPVSRGGSNTARNIQLLCEKCNRSKSANIGG